MWISIKNKENVNEHQKDRSSSLLGAVFYNQELIVQLLLEYGADTSIKNIFGDLESCDARSKWIRDNILNSKKTKFRFYQIINK